MPFRFSLQAVLRFRESFERREQQRLQAVTQELAKAQQERDQAKLDRSNAIVQLQKKLRRGVTAMEMQFELACDQARLRRIAALNGRLTKVEELRRRQLEAFRQAQQQRKILANLRDRQFAAYRLVQARREQQQMDDRHLATHTGRTSASASPQARPDNENDPLTRRHMAAALSLKGERAVISNLPSPL